MFGMSRASSSWFPRRAFVWPALPSSRAHEIAEEAALVAVKAGGGVDFELDSVEIQAGIRRMLAEALPRVGESDQYHLVTRAYSYARIIRRIRQPFSREKPAVRTIPEDLRDGLFLVLNATPNGTLAEATAYSYDVHEKYRRVPRTKAARDTMGRRMGDASRALVVAVADQLGSQEP